MSFLSGISGNGWGMIAGGILGAIGSHNSGKDLQAGANKGAATDWQRWQQLQQQMSPWTQAGGAAQGSLNNYLGLGAPSGSGYGSLLKGYGQNVPAPFQYSGQAAPGAFNPTAYKDFTIDDFQKMSPAYAFQKQQGMQGVLNGSASGAGALSGAAQKDLIGYNQGLANTSFNTAFGQNMAEQQQRYAQQLGQYEQQLQGYNSQFGNQLAGYGMNLGQQQQGFNQYQQQQQNIYNRLLGISGMGQQATGELGSFGSDLSKDQAQGYTNAGTGAAYGQNGMTSGLQQAAYSLPWQDIIKGFGGGGGSPAGAGAAGASGASSAAALDAGYGSPGAASADLSQAPGMWNSMGDTMYAGTTGADAAMGSGGLSELTAADMPGLAGASGGGGVADVAAAGGWPTGMGGGAGAAGGGAGAGAAGGGGAAAAGGGAEAAPAATGSVAGGLAGAGIGAAITAKAITTQPYNLDASWWKRFLGTLKGGGSGNATYDKYTPQAFQTYKAKQSLYGMLLDTAGGKSGMTSSVVGKQGNRLPPEALSLAKSFGMLNKDGSVNMGWSAGPRPASSIYSSQTPSWMGTPGATGNANQRLV